MNFAAANRYLLGLPRFDKYGSSAFAPGQERINRLLETMGQPHRQYPSVLVAGTNGKGSTASMLAAIGTVTGRRIGLHTSPHLVSVVERMRVDGESAEKEWITTKVHEYKPLFDRVGPSFFETTVALSLLYFAEKEIDLAIVEVGLGGRLDATNMLDAGLSIITHIGYDHTELLGSTLSQIAEEKAGIIKNDKPVLTGVDQKEAMDVIRLKSRSKNAPVYRIDDDMDVLSADSKDDHSTITVQTPLRLYENLILNLAGRHQIRNAMLAIRASELLLDEVLSRSDSVYRGLKDICGLSGLRGRLEIRETEPLIVADVAHNAEGLGVVLDYISSIVKRKQGRLFVLFGVMQDKALNGMIQMLAKATVYLVTLESDRAAKPEELKVLCRQSGIDIAGTGTVSEGVSCLLKRSDKNDVILVTGSHQVVAGLY